MKKSGEKQRKNDADIQNKPKGMCPKLDTVDEVHAYYQKIISCMPNNIYWLNRENIALGCNNNVLKLIGLKTLNQFVGITYEKMGELAGWTAGQALSFKQDDMEVMSTGIAKYNVEEPPIYDKTGDPIYYMSSRVPLFDDNGNAIGVVGISVDITTQKQAERALAEQIDKTSQAYRSKSEFLATASHEIRNPIGNVISSIQLFKEYVEELKNNFYDVIDVLMDAGKTEAVNSIKSLFIQTFEYTEQARAESYRALNSLINLGDLHRLQAEGIQTKYEISNLKNLLNSAINNNIYPNENKVDIHLSMGSSLPEDISIDYINIHEALCVIIGNAVRFSEKKGIVKISVDRFEESDNDFLNIIVQDFGVGMSDIQLSNLFETLYIQDGKEMRNRYWKPSLQLSQAKIKIEASGGVLEIKSAFGKGTTVTIKIPYCINEFENKNYLPESVKLAKNACNILLVEDDVYAQKIMKNYLETLQYKVDTALTSSSAIELAIKNFYDIIFIDITLPDKNGVETMCEIQKHSTCNSSLFIAITSHVSENDIDYFISQGMVTVLAKPITKDIFKKCIEDVLAARSNDDD